MTNEIMWISFIVIIFGLLVFDLGFINRKAHAVATKEASILTIFYVIMSLIFAMWVYMSMGVDKSFEFLTAYIVEKSLSVDNLFVFITVMTYFKVDLKYQHRVLFWGILGALVTRGIFIFVGMFAISLIHALIYLLGAILLYTGYKILTKEDEITNPGENRVLKIANEYLPVKKDYIGSSFVIRELQTCLEIPLKNRIFKIMSKIPIINRIPTISPKRDFMEGSKTINKMKFLATPLLLVLLVIESTDIVFATDSVPAVLSVSRDTFIVYTSNIFAILGLRALYFVVASMMVEFDYLKYGIAIVLSFIGVKMLASNFYHISTGLSLAVVVICLTVSVIASLIWKKEKVDNKQVKNASK